VIPISRNVPAWDTIVAEASSSSILDGFNAPDQVVMRRVYAAVRGMAFAVYHERAVMGWRVESSEGIDTVVQEWECTRLLAHIVRDLWPVFCSDVEKDMRRRGREA